MKEFIDKLIERLEERADKYRYLYKNCKDNPVVQYDFGRCDGIREAISIVNQLAEEHKGKSVIMDDLKIFLQKKFEYCAEQAEMNLEAECNSEIDSYFRERKELYLDRANIYGEVMREFDRLAEEMGVAKYAITNADRIRSMTDEELGKAMFNFILKAASNPDFIMSPQKYTDWLQSEADTKGE